MVAQGSVGARGLAAIALVDVGHAVVVVVALLLGADPPVVRVADAQHDRREQRGEQRAEQDADLDVVVGLAAGAEGQLADQQRHGEPDPGQQGQPEHVPPAQPVGELGPGEALDQPGGAEHADRLADDQPGDDPEGDRVGQRGADAAESTIGHPGGEEREHRDGEAGRDRAEPVLEVLGQAGPGPFGAPDHRHGEPEQHPGDGGVHAGRVHQRPGDARPAAAAATRSGPGAAPAPRTRPAGPASSSSGTQDSSSV